MTKQNGDIFQKQDGSRENLFYNFFLFIPMIVIFDIPLNPSQLLICLIYFNQNRMNMKKTYFYMVAAIAGIFLFAGVNPPSNQNAVLVGPEIKSISSLTFGPDGILFIGDSKSATVFAVNTKDVKQQKKLTAVEIKNIDQKIAAALGTEVANITITDMAVNPYHKKLYLAVQNSDGTPVLLTLNGDKIEPVFIKRS